MTQDEIIEMARQAGALTVFRMTNQYKLSGNAAIEAFAKLVAAKERKTILLNTMKARNVDGNCDIVLCAEIRARGEA